MEQQQPRFDKKPDNAANEGGRIQSQDCKRQRVNEESNVSGDNQCEAAPSCPEPDPTEDSPRWKRDYKDKRSFLAAERVPTNLMTPLMRQLMEEGDWGRWGIGQLLVKFNKHFEEGNWPRAQAYRLALYTKGMRGVMWNKTPMPKCNIFKPGVCFLLKVDSNNPKQQERFARYLSEAPSSIFDQRMDRAISDAFGEGNVLRLKALVAAGADPAFAREPGETGLHAAAYCGDVEFVEALVYQHQVTSVRDAHKMLPADLAAMRGHGRVLTMLQRDTRHQSNEIATISAYQRLKDSLREAGGAESL